MKPVLVAVAVFVCALGVIAAGTTLAAHKALADWFESPGDLEEDRLFVFAEDENLEDMSRRLQALGAVSSANHFYRSLRFVIPEKKQLHAGEYLLVARATASR